MGSWAGWGSPGRRAGLWVPSGPQHPLGSCLEEGWWHMAEVRLRQSSVQAGWLQSRSCHTVTYICTRRRVACKNAWHVVAKQATFFQKRIRPQLEYGIWAPHPSPALSLLHRQLTVTKPQLNMACLEGATGSRLSPSTVLSIWCPWFGDHCISTY